MRYTGTLSRARRARASRDRDCQRGDQRSITMDPSALDMAIQHALAGLYPPFEATAPTVLGQVFRLLDSDFRGDGLSFLLDFLIPAKRLCEQVREAACALYTHCLFLHEGWPLCLRDEVVVHLAPLNPLLLRQGDFYLQVESWEEQSVHMTLKCLSSDLREVDKKPIPESSYSLIFTPEWLEAINNDFEGRPLHNCLVASEVAELLSYLCSVPRLEDKAKGLLVVIDARKGTQRPGLVSALQGIQALAPASVSKVLLLGEKASIPQLSVLPAQVEVLTSLKALRNHVDPSQLPEALEGPFPYHHSEWVQFFQKLDPFLTDLRQASSLLQASIQEFEKGEPPGGVQEATRCLSKSKELMETVLRDPGLLALQREGGTTLASLQQEASGLNANPDVRSHLTEAAALYNLVDGQLHDLVTASNQLLRRLELRVRLGHLETAIHQVSDWMAGEGSQSLQALAPVHVCAETVEKVHAEFEDFFLQVAAFQARLTHFYMAAERQRTDLETLLHLHRFRRKMSRFHMDCQNLLTQLSLGKAVKASPGDQLHLRLHCYLKRLASEFQTEKLLAMKLQVASLSRPGLGQEVWEEAQERHQEIQSLLRKALAYCPCPEVPATQVALIDRSRPVAKGQGLPREVGSKWDRSLQDSLAVDHVFKSQRTPQGEQSRNMWAGLLSPEPGQSGDTEEVRGTPKLPDPTLERLLASLFSWPHLPKQSKASRPTGGSFSSEGTGSQTSLEDSPHTSPPASL